MPRRIACLLLLVGLVAGCAGPAPATPEPTGDSIYIENAWARPSPLPNGSTAIYLTIVNPLDSADQLVGASSALGMTGVHESITENGIVRMEALPAGIAIPPRSRVDLAPGGIHIMVMGVAKPLAVGDQVSVTVTFEQRGALTITVPVGETP